MPIRYVIETLRENGTRESTWQEFQSQLTVGRGGRSDQILPSDLLALEHARFEMHEDTLIVVDLAPVVGVVVNELKVPRKALSSGDTVSLADINISVSKSAGKWILTEERGRRATGAERLENAAAALSVSASLPALRTVVLFTVVASLILFGLVPLSGIGTQSWSTGPLHSAHRMIESKCQSCHDSSFSRVKDSQCQVCHKLTEHSKRFADLTPHTEALQRPCISCHSEHHGNEGLKPKSSKLCAECHNTLSTLAPNSKFEDRADFDGHPKFKLPQRDLSAIKLNHATHLAPGIRGPQGPTTLSCRDCHRVAGDFETIVPISFENNCRSCHSLGFDDRLPGDEVPHGSADDVYNFIYAEYAKLYLLEQDNQSSTAIFPRQKPGSAPFSVEERKEFSRSVIESESRSAEQMLFTKTGCFLCHDVSKKSDLRTPRVSAMIPPVSNFEIKKPEIPSRWLPAARFGHGAHEEMRCQSCHKGVEKSHETSDVLIPQIENCRDCHMASAEKDKVKSDCVMCHSYHDSLPLDQKQKRY